MVAATVPQGYTVGTLARSWMPAGEDVEEAPQLRWPDSVRIFARMEREDPQIESALLAALLPIHATSWRIDTAGAAPEVAEWVARCLGLPLVGAAGAAVTQERLGGRFSFEQHLDEALTSLVFGHAFFEQQYEWDQAAARFRLRKLGWRPPATIAEVQVAADGGLEAIRQQDSKAPIVVERLVAYAHQRRGGNWLGRSMLRSMYKPWVLKDRMLRVGSETVERNGMGVPIYEAPPLSPLIADVDEADARQKVELDAGLKLARGMRSGPEAAAAITHGAKLTMSGVQGELPDAEKWVRYYDEQINRSVLAHFLNLGVKTGSWALGSTFADFFALGLQSVANEFARVFQQHVIEDLVDVNWGPAMPAPRLVWDEIGSTSPATAEALQSLVQTRVVVPDDDLEQYMRNRYRLPTADPTTARVVADGADQTATPAPATIDEPGEGQ